MITYVVKAKKNPLDRSQVRYYIQAAPTVPVDFTTIAKNISSRCTVTEPDVLAVLNALQTEVIRAVQNGQSVRLGQLGSFRATICSSGVENKNEASVLLVKSVRARFTPGSQLRSALQLTNADMKFIKYGDLE